MGQFVAGDTASELRVACLDNQSRLPIDLTDRAVKLRFKTVSDGPVPVDPAIVERTMAVQSPENAGIASYVFSGSELVSGEMFVDVQVEDGGGNILTSLRTLRFLVGTKLA